MSKVERKPARLHQLPLGDDTMRRYASRSMRPGGNQMIGGDDLSWARGIDESSPEYTIAVERTIKALKDWGQRRKNGQSS
ncbi:MAG: hypothetical protein AAB521_02455 [Patescibacteria group bacterium]